MTIGPKLQVEPVQTDDSSKNLYAVFHEESGSLAIDYSSYYERIATSLEIIATKMTEIESHQQALKNQAEGKGIHIKGPYEWLSMAAIYRIFVEQGVDFDSIKQQVEALPKEQGFE